MITPEPMKGVVWQTVALVKLQQPAQGVVWQTVALVKLRQPAHPSQMPVGERIACGS